MMHALVAQENLRRYLRTGVAVDTGLLLLLTVGYYENSYVSRFKLTSFFSDEDYELLAEFLSKFRNVVLTPHVLAELSNLAFKLPSGRLDGYLDRLRQLLLPLPECYVEKNPVLTHGDFKNLGVADVGLVISCLEGPYLLLTSDRRLSGIARRNGVDALHFDELRGYVWFAD